MNAETIHNYLNPSKISRPNNSGKRATIKLIASGFVMYIYSKDEAVQYIETAKRISGTESLYELISDSGLDLMCRENALVAIDFACAIGFSLKDSVCYVSTDIAEKILKEAELYLSKNGVYLYGTDE